MNIDESLVQRSLIGCPKLPLGKILKEFERTRNFFKNKQDETWSRCESELIQAIDTRYPRGVQWTPFIRIPDETLRNTVVPREITEKYIRCNVYCGQHLRAEDYALE